VPNKDPVIPQFTIKLPLMLVEPVIELKLPDILLSKNAKFPSPSAYVNGEFFILEVVPEFCMFVVRNTIPI
jgi:hypothetical protein